MKTIRLLCLSALLLRSIATVWSQPYTMPQDNWYGPWYDNGLQISGNFGDIAIGPDGNIYVATNNSAVSVFTTNGTFLRQFGSNMNIVGLAVSSKTNIYVLDLAATNHVEIYTTTGSFLFSFGADGTNDAQIQPGGSYGIFTVHGLLAIGANDQVYVADGGNNRIQLYDQNGNHITHWGQGGPLSIPGGIPSYFFQLGGITALANGDICAANFYPGAYNNDARFYELQLFNGAGAFLGLESTSLSANSVTAGYGLGQNSYVAYAIANAPDGIVCTSLTGPVDPYTYGGGGVGSVQPANAFEFGRGTTNTLFNSIAFDQRGTMYVTLVASSSLVAFQRLYSITPPATNSLVPPQPYIATVNQRSNSSLVDIQYYVVDLDTNVVTTALLAFANSGNDFSTVLRPTAFVEGTSANLGAAIPANTNLLITWDASELATNFVNLQFEVLASDGRTLLPFDFITIPALQTNAAFTMSRSPVQDSDLLSVWFWLLATNNPAISLTNGTIIGVGGTYNGQTLASGASTTSQGRSFLYQLLDLAVPTASQVAIAKSGNFGFISVDPNNSVVKLP